MHSSLPLSSSDIFQLTQNSAKSYQQSPSILLCHCRLCMLKNIVHSNMYVTNIYMMLKANVHLGMYQHSTHTNKSRSSLGHSNACFVRMPQLPATKP